MNYFELYEKSKQVTLGSTWNDWVLATLKIIIIERKGTRITYRFTNYDSPGTFECSIFPLLRKSTKVRDSV